MPNIKLNIRQLAHTMCVYCQFHHVLGKPLLMCHWMQLCFSPNNVAPSITSQVTYHARNSTCQNFTSYGCIRHYRKTCGEIL